jgi:hypothetical protein
MRLFWMIALTIMLAVIPGHAQQATPSADTVQPAAQPAKEKINPPMVLYRVDPEFSEEARRKHISGRCLISLILDVKGIPQDLKVIRCTDPSFEQTSLDAVAKFRYKPATTQDGKSVSAMISVEINYSMDGGNIPGIPIRYGFSSPPGVISNEPNSEGVYSLTKLATPPIIIRFFDEGYEEAAFSAVEKSACDIVLTISVKGKATDPVVTHCERPSLETPAVQSLLKSHFKPGQINGKAVPMRASIHLESADIPPKP